MPHSSISLITSSNTSRPALHISHYPITWYASPTLYCYATRAHLCIYFLLPAAGIPSFFFLAGPGHLHEIAVSAFSRSSSHFPVYLLRFVLRFHLVFLSANLFLPSILFFFFCLVPCKLPGGHHLFLVPPYIPPYFLIHAILPYSSSPFCYSLPYSSINCGW